ncbi:MAG: mandelate racemase/muconate lactonizing enzyme family protein [Ectothiorhodospiraceae bacterium AqS1]|nr:mandelate racemase/muconate lactonizing enzyme family protein [Ectothiorhodospiraceae bacterium AqS1]
MTPTPPCDDPFLSDRSPIRRIETRRYRIPLPVVLSDSTHGEMRDFGLVMVEVHSDDGDRGLGYTYSVGDIGTGAIASMIADDLAPALIDADPLATEGNWQRMWWRVHFVGRGGIASFAIAALDIALWDIKGRRAGLPLWRLLGGADPKVMAYAGGIDLDFTIDALLEQAEAFKKAGFRAIKMKVGRKRIAEDVERAMAMREFLGPDFPLMADANMRWSVEQAIRAARELAPADLHWLEEPVIPDDIEGQLRVAREGGIAIAAGENLHSLHEFNHLIRSGGVDFPEPDAATLGGITPWMKVAHLAQANSLSVTSHGVHDIHVHLLAAVPNASLLEVHGFGLERFIEEPLAIREGFALAPSRPGHGIRFDLDALEAHRVG